MAEDMTYTEGGEEREDARTRSRAATIFRWIGLVFLGLIILVVLLLALLDTGPGRRFIVSQVDGMTLESGLQIELSGLDGSIYSGVIVENLQLSDLRGTFLTVPEARLDWHPFALIGNHVDVDALIVPAARLERLPELRPSDDPDAPLLPQIDIDIDKLEIGRLVLGEEISGAERILSAAGEAHIADGRAQVDLDVRTIGAGTTGGGDRLSFVLDAVPEENELDLDLQLTAPANGLVASLLGLQDTLVVEAGGEGSWEAWDGALVAALGGQRIADVDIGARSGTFRLEGPLQIGVFTDNEILSRLAGPQSVIDLTAVVDDGAADLDLGFRSAALVLEGGGTLDTEASELEGMEFAFQLLQPFAINEILSGQNVAGSVAISGPTSQPQIDYRVNAATLSASTTTFERLTATGRIDVGENAILIPVNARAARISGLPDLLAQLMTGVLVDATFVVADGQMAAREIGIRSDKLNAQASLFVDLSDSSYRGAVQGRAPGFVFAPFGVFDARADIRYNSLPGGAFALTGPIRAESRRIDNALLERLAGGSATVTGNLLAPGTGVYGLTDMQIDGPEIDATGFAKLLPSGELDVYLAGTSEAYGPFTADISGTADAPQIDITAASPSLGLPFENVVAQVRGTPAGYEITATGDTQFGPASAELLFRSEGEASVIEVRRVELANIVAEGELRQTPAGPFAGQLSLSGNGLGGAITLAERNGFQVASIDVNGRNVSLPGEAQLSIGRLLVDMDVALTETVPVVEGTAQVANLAYGSFRVQRARAAFDYENERGAARIVAEGSTPTPYEIALNSRFTASQIVAAINGEVSGEEFRTAEPLRVSIDEGTYTLAPARIRLRGGEVELAARYGEGLYVQSRFEDFALDILNTFAPGAGFSGNASGSFDWTQESADIFPEADMRLVLDDFRRSGAVAVSQPIDAEIAGTLDARGGNLSGVIKERGRNVGRVRASLSPLSQAAGSWQERLLNSPLGGGLRYNGPAGALFSFSGLAGQALTGQIAIAADFDGRVDAPRVTGRVRSESLTYENEIYGTRITELALLGRFTNDSLLIEQLQGRAGDGTVSASGSVSLSAADEYPIDIDLTFDNAQLADADNIAARVSGTLDIVNGPNRPASISGDLTIPEARYQLIRSGEEGVVDLAGVRRESGNLQTVEEAAGGEEEDEAAPPSIWQLDIDVSADNRIFVSGMGLESEWEAAFNIGGTATDYRVGGNVELIRGTLGFANQRFELTRGTIELLRGEEINPAIDIRAETDIGGVTAIIAISGRAMDPQIEFTSNPARPEEEVLSLILFGGPPSELGAIEAVQLAASLNSLRGSGGGGLNPLGELRQATGIDRLRVLGGDEATGRGTALAAGTYLGDDVYLEVITDARGFTATQIEIALTRAFSVLSSVSTFGGQGAAVRYSKDY